MELARSCSSRGVPISICSFQDKGGLRRILRKHDIRAGFCESFHSLTQAVPVSRGSVSPFPSNPCKCRVEHSRGSHLHERAAGSALHQRTVFPPTHQRSAHSVASNLPNKEWNARGHLDRFGNRTFSDQDRPNELTTANLWVDRAPPVGR